MSNHLYLCTSMDEEVLKGENSNWITKLIVMTSSMLIKTHFKLVNHFIQLRKIEETPFAASLSCQHQNVRSWDGTSVNDARNPYLLISTVLSIRFSWCPVPPCFFEWMNTRHIIIPLKMLTCSSTTLVGASLSLSLILFPQCHENHWWVYLSGIDLHKHITLISS